MPRGVYIHKKGRKITWGDKISEALKGHTFSKEHKLQFKYKELLQTYSSKINMEG